VEKGKDMELTEDDVLHILKLIDESKFDYFQLEVGELKITVSKGEPIPLASSSANARVAPSPAPGVGKPSKATPVSPAPAARSPAPNIDAKAAAAEGLVPITAPLLGTFYVAPEPGAPPFVQVGAAITEDTTVGLIEVMKVFNSVRASVKGTIAQVVAQNGQFVEYGQTLFLVKP
jgi:acetyl-CoA carboxylase biotin carboxyl carrier protein